MAVRFCEKYKEIDLTHLVSEPEPEVVDNSLALYQWTITEDIQDHSPYVEWGWDGFVLFIHYRI